MRALPSARISWACRCCTSLFGLRSFGLHCCMLDRASTRRVFANSQMCWNLMQGRLDFPGSIAPMARTDRTLQSLILRNILGSDPSIEHRSSNVLCGWLLS